jgi:hypothetical protein
MNIFKRLFHSHQYKTLISAPREFKISYYFNNSITSSSEDPSKIVVVAIRRCECGAEEAFISDGQMTTHINPEYAKMVLNYKE